MRAAALVVAGDAAYGMGAYRLAAERYSEALLSDELPPNAAHATLALGWAELRLGRREDARLTWMRVARQFPSDPAAPIALILAAELSAQTGEMVVARKLLDRALEGHPVTPEAQIARLSRSILAMRDGRTQEAARDLRMLARSGGPSVPVERRKLLDGLMATGTQAGPEHQMLLTNQYVAGQPGLPSTDGRPQRDESATAPDTAGMLERFAAPFLDGAGDPETTPRVLHGLLLVAVEDKAWPEVQTLAGRLVDRFPGYTPAPELLVQVAGQAAAEQQWPVVRTSYEYATARSRPTVLAPQAQVDFAEALFRTGNAAQARVELTRFVDTAPRAQEAPRALHLLAEVSETLDEPREALAAYERLRRDFPRAERTTQSLLSHARLLQYAVGQEKQAQALLEDIVQRTEGEERAEASFRLAQVLAGEGKHPSAVDWYMAAAYGTAEHSRWYRSALLGAGHSLVALKRSRAALAVYRNVLPSTPIGPLPRDGRPAPEPIAQVEEPELVAEAAYQIAQISRAAGRNEEAVDMYLTAAYLAPGSQGRALMGAVRSLVAVGDRASAEAVFRRLVESSGEEPEILTQASKVFRRGR
ncbi:MAG TPA: tetratricopeptide repeat protein [Methylomirabilota bacterium]|nr:tetratricopeptide repeat protein [Methylomirabilota bacterium]